MRCQLTQFVFHELQGLLAACRFWRCGATKFGFDFGLSVACSCQQLVDVFPGRFRYCRMGFPADRASILSPAPFDAFLTHKEDRPSGRAAQLHYTDQAGRPDAGRRCGPLKSCVYCERGGGMVL